ncbi:MAG: DUF5067 domain-containing protein [Oscillospiraceae bacterium]|nr:DUF5067 domain-containing protein [Oscillospiraceae bacterium]
MKKLLAFLLALCLLLSLCACGKKAPDPEVGPATETEEDIDGPGGLEDVSDPFVEDMGAYPGELPIGGETASGQIIEVGEEATLEYIGSKIVANDYGDPTLASWFNFYKTGDYEDCAAYCLTVYARQGEEDLWTTSYTYNGVEPDESLYEEVFPGDSLEVCYVYELENLVDPVTFTFNDIWEELEPIELVIDLAEVEKCLDAPEGISGLFKATYLMEGDKTASYEELVESGMAENTYVDLYEDGTGIFCFNGYEYDIIYDAENFYIEDDVYYYTYDGEYFTIEGEDVYYEYIRYEEPEEEPEEEDFVGETVTTKEGYVSITLQKGWYVDEETDHGYTLVLYHEDLGPAKWVKISDPQLTTLEKELEYTQLSMASAEYQEVTFGDNTYQMLYSDTYGPQAYMVAETSTGKAIVIEVRSVPLEDVMDMLESIVIH